MCWNDLGADGAHHQRGEAEHELALGDVLDHHLVRHVDDGAGARVRLVAALDVAIQEDVLPRHEHVVEDHDRVHLLEARAERMIEVRAAVVDALAADEAQARRVVRNGEAERVRRVFLRALQQRRGEHHDLVGDRQRREHAAAADDDAGIGFLLDARGEERVRLLRRAHGAIGLRRNQRVRQAQIVLAQILVVANGVGAEARIGLGEKRRAGGVAGHRAIDVVRHATHHAVACSPPTPSSRG